MPDVRWIRDSKPHNKIDDTIDSSAANTFDVVINYRRAVQESDIDFIERTAPQCTVQRRLKYLSSVAVAGLTKGQILVIASDPDIAFIEQQFHFASSLHVSVPSICVTSAPDGCSMPVPADIDGQGVNIAILDSGVDEAHDAFANTPSTGGYNALTDDFVNPIDDNGHGTNVASIALGQATANTSRGVAPGAGLVDVKVLGANNRGPWDKISAGLETIYDNRNAWMVRVINMSIEQLDDNDGPVPSDGLDSFSQLVDLAESMGIVVVAAAGNHGPANTGFTTPAAATRAITVAASCHMDTASRLDDAIASFSNAGPRGSDNDDDLIDELKPEVAAAGSSPAWQS